MHTVFGLVFGASLVFAQATKPIDDARLKAAGKTGGDWLTYGLTQAETRYSPLNQINATNVSRLGLAWSYDLGKGGGTQEDTPLVSDGVIYGITNWSVVFALDARTGKERWRWDPEINQDAVFPKLCCGVVNRGVALYQNLVIAPLNDGRLVALDSSSGRVVWEARVGFTQDQYTLTMAPRIAKGKVIIGASGGDRPTRGFFSAFDALTGRLAWKFYTIPGDPSKPFENAAMKKAAETWEGDFWKLGGGGAVWDGLAYDPEADLIYVGTGNAEPWPEQLRKSKDKDNLYVCSVLAVKPDTGELKWYFQMVPADSWDFDSVQQLMLADLTIKGRQRKVLMQANKNGFYYVLDRITGQFISGQPFGYVTWARGLNEETGRPIVNEQAKYGSESILISPGGGGAHNWSPMSFNPNTGLVYIPTSTNNNWIYGIEDDFKVRPGHTTGIKPRGTAAVVAPPPGTGMQPIDGDVKGALVAWDPVTQQAKWRNPGGGGIGGGTVSTAGNLVFQVIPDGRLVAYRADTGEKLLDIKTGLRGGMAPPVTYMVDGKQYVTLMGGTGAVRPRITGDEEHNAPAAPVTTGPPNPPKMLTFVLDGAAVL